MELEFTKEELEVINNYLMRKLDRLEASGLEDSYCYPRLYTFRIKMMQLQDKLQDNEKICLQVK